MTPDTTVGNPEGNDNQDSPQGPPVIEGPDENETLTGELTAVLRALRGQLQLDLGCLRPSMLRRRIETRMTLWRIGTMPEYVQRLLADVAEARALTHDAIVGVTGFFREPAALDRLRRQLEQQAARMAPDDPFRIWVPACSTGEEAFSIAMLAHEVFEQSGAENRINVFATDVDEDSLAYARRATYPISTAAVIGAARLDKYFRTNEIDVAAKPLLRDMLVFGPHNLLSDPPFTRIDLASCRNFLCYLTTDAQERVLASLHSALHKGGTLFLGPTESLGPFTSGFDIVDARHRVFTKARQVARVAARPTGASGGIATTEPPAPSYNRGRNELSRRLLETLAAREGATMAVLSPSGAVLDVIADHAGALKVPVGTTTSDAVRLLTGPFAAHAMVALQRLRRGERRVELPVGAGATGPAGQSTASMRLSRIAGSGGSDDRVLLEIRVSNRGDMTARSMLADSHDAEPTATDHLQAAIKDLQSSNDEHRSANDDLAASNEELQRSNEELQSLNEELLTVNAEYQHKLHELSTLNSDVNNLLKCVDAGLVILDENLRIRRYSPAIEHAVKLRDADIGQSIESLATHLGGDVLVDARRVLESGQAIDRDLRSAKGRWLRMRAAPYTNADGKCRGVVLSFLDSTPVRNAHEAARAANKQLAHANHALSSQREELEEMFSIVAHDLKRPVLALDGLLTLIRGVDAGPSRIPAGGDEIGLLQRAQAECVRMRQMLVDLESISGIQHRPIVTETVDGQRWLDELLVPFRPIAETRGARLNCTCDAGPVTLAKSFAEEIIVNIVENALHYGCTNPMPRVDVSGRVDREAFEVSIADNGKGIAKHNHQKIFEPFRRLDADTVPGSGVGLMAVKRLLHRLGGDISLESAPSQGAKFVVRIPLAASPGDDPANQAHKPRVLLVEDDVLDARGVERCLQGSHLVTRAQDMKEAEECLKRGRYDVVLLDLSLPDGHGFELVNRMRTALEIHTPVVVITGQGTGLTPRDMDAMIAAYVSKAELQRETLVKAVRQAINSPIRPPIAMIEQKVSHDRASETQNTPR